MGSISIPTPSRSMIRGMLAAAVVVVGGAALVGSGAIGPAAGIGLAAKVGAAVAARYAAKQLIDAAPDGARSTGLRGVMVPSMVAPLHLSPIPVSVENAVILAALGDAPEWGVVS